jgi:hypothetical protein
MGGEGGGGCGVSANEYSCAHGAQINFGELKIQPKADLFLKLEVELAGRIGDALESLLSPSPHLHLSPPSVTQMAETRIFYIRQNISVIDHG